MTEESSSSGGSPFSSRSEREEEFVSPESGRHEAAFDPSKEAFSAGLDSSFALQVARTWITDHQNAAMLGAFATGVLIGAFLRD